MGKEGIFKTDFGGTAIGDDPEVLFRDLRNRAPEVKHLWSHQADLLRDYHQRFTNASDVAIQIPTGAGKTLVGLLIGEYLRQTKNDRVAYICPTRQLARQVGAQASKYGIKAHVFIGKQRDYPPAEFSEFQASAAIAITTYSAIFNSNPRIDDSNILILDDAHASENNIASMWSVEISRSEHQDIFNSLIGLFQQGLPPAFYSDLTETGQRSFIIELLPGKYIRENSKALIDYLDKRIEAKSTIRYAWDLIKGNLAACNIYLSWNSILIRPLIPPTLTHPPFSQAKQRIYMSATLGAGGELERITGVKAIQRLPIPSGWEKRGSGRRLFLIPQVSMSDSDSFEVAMDSFRNVERSLILVPNQIVANRFASELDQRGFTALYAKDIEDSIDPFSKSEKTILVLSRYDGLDLPDDACRLLVIGGLPSGTNLQEQFLWSRVAAFSLLRDRVLTRFTQGVGRCTRSDNDFAIVIVLGRDMVDFILKRENRRILNSELQAELEFGFQNSRGKDIEGFKTLREAFFEQGEEWEKAEEALTNLREQYRRHTDPVSEKLRSVVSDEISCHYSMWSGDLEAALEFARRVADNLGGDETKGYRGWWYYLAADAAMALHDENDNPTLIGTAQDLLKRSSTCCVAISWFARLAREIGSRDDHDEVDDLTAEAIENVRNKLTEWGAVGSRFEEELESIVHNLQSTKYKAFHRGLQGLGETLGFRSELPDSNAAPDCVWSIGDAVYVVHEAKSGQSIEGAIGVNDVRQAQSHEDWIRNNRLCYTKTKILNLIESPRGFIEAETKTYAKSLYHVFPSELVTLFNEVCAVLRQIRSHVTDLSDEKILEEIFEQYNSKGLTPSNVVRRLSNRLLRKMSTQGSTKGGN